MFQTKPWIEQTDPPRSPKETLPTMYDLASEDPQEPGLPDEFHDLQPQLLTLTCRSRHCPSQQMFTGTDINLYYDVRHPLWHKRPDWFVAVGVPRLYDEVDLRLSYVIWQEGVSPLVVVEFLSPGTAKEDLGANIKAAAADEGLSSANQSGASTPSEGENGKSTGDETVKETPPRKWEVYEQILRVPYYVVFSRYTNRVRFFQLAGGHYQEQELDREQPRVWIPELELGLGLWQGEYQGIERLWLRWYDAKSNWVLTETEQERQEKELALQQAEQERQRAEAAQARAEAAQARAEELAQRLRDLGIDC
ncbi:MAG: Uma2 family endonuclease [Chroococcidiopsidaceae cyanobacterium CP_BM_RX_35]|nr:Uma2 family endonuclease [Chroococcidiopsidaceae cyanobacterium CP_BM_RX_35]